MSTKLIIESLSMDLLRAALGLHCGSISMAEKFKQEAFKMNQKLESITYLDSYSRKLVYETKKTLENESTHQAETLLMLSVLFKNLAQSKYSD